jgi:isochorismate synthase EntC
MDLNENDNYNNDLSNRDNKFYLQFTQRGKIIIKDDKKYFQCESDEETFLVKSKGNYHSQDTDIIDEVGYFSVIPICDSSGAILSYHIIELDKKATIETFIIQARVKLTIKTGAVQLLISIKGSTNLTIPVQTNNQFKMTNGRIYLCQGYRANNKIYISNYALIPETITNEGKTTIVEQFNTNIDKYAEVVSSDHNGVLLYIPANQLESTQWHPTVDKKYKLVAHQDGIKIVNAAPVNIDDSSEINIPKICQYCIYEVNSICRQSDSPLFSSIVAPDSTCIKCTV